MNTLSQRNAVNLLHLCDTEIECQDRMAKFVHDFGRLPTLGELPAWYCYGYSSLTEAIDKLNNHFIVRMENDELILLYFEHL